MPRCLRLLFDIIKALSRAQRRKAHQGVGWGGPEGKCVPTWCRHSSGTHYGVIHTPCPNLLALLITSGRPVPSPSLQVASLVDPLCFSLVTSRVPVATGAPVCLCTSRARRSGATLLHGVLSSTNYCISPTQGGGDLLCLLLPPSVSP